MSAQLLTLLPAVLIGLAVGLAVRHFRRDWAMNYGNWAANLGWKVHAAIGLMFALMGLLETLNHRYVYVAVHATLAVLAVYCAFRAKFYPAKPSQAS
ncbi:MAG: hypothetical protein JNL96_13955 [Planctomycetaceae bacterium]|nr:hypothetical protein [Planctomycetaceae bacterium]